MSELNKKLVTRDGNGNKHYHALYSSPIEIGGPSIGVRLGKNKAYCAITDDLAKKFATNIRFKKDCIFLGREKRNGLILPLTNKLYKMKDVYPKSYNTLTEFKDAFEDSLLTTAEEMFKDCAEVSEFPSMSYGQFTSMKEMYSGCTSLKGNFPYKIDVSKISSHEYLRDMFKGTGVTKVYFINCNLNFSKQITAELLGLPEDAEIKAYLPTIVLTDKKYKMCDIFPDTYETMTSIENLLDTSRLTTGSKMFEGCEALEEIPEIDVSNIEDASYMFSYCSKIKKIPNLLNFKNIKNMCGMFEESGALEEIPEIDTKNVSDFAGCFYGTGNKWLTVDNIFPYEIDLSSLSIESSDDTKKIIVKSLTGIMPNECTSVTFKNFPINFAHIKNAYDEAINNCKIDFYRPKDYHLDIHFKRYIPKSSILKDIYKNYSIMEGIYDEVVLEEGRTNGDKLFEGFTALKDANVTDLSKITSAKRMFYNCESLESIPSSIDINKLSNIKEIFYNCRNIAVDKEVSVNGQTVIKKSFPVRLSLQNIKTEEDVKDMLKGTGIEYVEIVVDTNNPPTVILTNELLGLDSDAILKNEKRKIVINESPYLTAAKKYSIKNYETLEYCPATFEIASNETYSFIILREFFKDWSALKEIGPEDIYISNSKITSLSGESMFENCTSLKTVMPGSILGGKIKKYYIMTGNKMFKNCTNLEYVCLVNDDGSSVINAFTEANNMFENCTSLPEKFFAPINGYYYDPDEKSSYYPGKRLKDIFKGSSVKEVIFTSVKDNVKPLITPELLGKSDINIIFE